MATPAAVFGPGILILTRTDVTPSPAINVGFVQEFSLDAAGNIKELYGQKQYPLAVARSTIKATGKIKAAVISGIAWNTAFYGQSSLSTASILAWNIDSTFSLSTASTAVTVGSSLTWDADLSVRYASGANAGLPFQRVATGSESTGKYSVNTSTATGNLNVYNFAAGDTTSLTAGTTIPIKVTYSSTTGSGELLAVTNQNIGVTPTFQIDYYTNFNQPSAKPFVVRVFSAVANKHAMAFKLEDFMMPEFDFSVFADASDRVWNLYFPEVA